jgi:hypothetical protein
MYGKEPEVTAIHAGLECGIIKEKYPDMDMISFGPTMRDVPSPAEKLQISTVPEFFNQLKTTLNNLKQLKNTKQNKILIFLYISYLCIYKYMKILMNNNNNN